MNFQQLKQRIVDAANEQSQRMISENSKFLKYPQLSIYDEALRIKKTFKLSGWGSTLCLLIRKTYPPNMFPAIGVLLDSYPADLAAFMLAFCFRGQLKGNLMMFLEDMEKIEALRQKLMDKRKESRINKAAEVIARCLCLMDLQSFARGTFLGMVNPSMRERVKAKLFELDKEVALFLTQ